MTVDCPSPVNTSTSRVRRHRERLRNGLRLLTVTVPETVIENTIARGLLAAAGRADPWPVIHACYAAQLSDAALAWLVNGGVIAHEQRGDAGAFLRGISRWLEQAFLRAGRQWPSPLRERQTLNRG